MYIEQLKSMFSDMVEKKDSALIPEFYHPEFEMHVNGQVQDYEYFKEYHEKIYTTEISYSVFYDENTFLEQEDKVAARVFIKLNKPGESEKELEIILICQFKNNKIYRIWELCYPDWSKMPEFQQ